MDNANGHITAQPSTTVNDDSNNNTINNTNNNDTSSLSQQQPTQQSMSSGNNTQQQSMTVNANNNNNGMNAANVNVVNVGPSSMNTLTTKPLQKPSTTITRPPRQSSGMAAQDHYMNQMGIHGKYAPSNGAVNVGGAKPDDYDPDSNVYVANLPSDYGKERLYQLFSKYGQIVRYKFVTPDEPSQPGYGFVQFANRKDAHRAIKNLEGHLFGTGDTIYLSIALRRRSSLSDEPTNLYVKNLPSSWTNDKLRKVFGAYGQIRQSKVVGDGIAFVRFEDHDQALNAIGRLDKQMVEQGCKLEVRFATRKTAANAYRLQQIPQTKTNENNLYIRNLPKYYNQSSLETLFSNYGKISSAKINDNGIAFVRFAHAEDAKRAIQELNGKKPPQFEEEIVVKLAHFDIGDSRNRWANKFGPGQGGSGQGGGMGGNPTSNGNHFNQNMYQNHFNAPIGSMNSFNAFQQNPYASGGQNTTPLPSVPSSAAGFNNDPSQQTDVNINVNMNNNSNGNMNGNMNVMNQMQNMNNNNMQNFNLQAIQQQMQAMQLNGQLNNAQQYQQGNGAVGVNQFAFPQATPVMMQAPQLFNMNGQQQQQNGVNNVSQQQGQQNNVNGNIPHLPQAQLGRQGSSDSHHSGGAASPQSNHSNGSGDANKGKTWSKKQQELGDKLYQKVFAKTGQNYAPKITGMLIKMGDKKAQQCIDNPQFLDEQIQIAKKLLDTNEGVPAQGNNLANSGMNSPTTLIQQHSGSPTSTNNPLMNNLNTTNINRFNAMNAGSPTNNRFQTLNTKPHTPNAQMQQNVQNVNIQQNQPQLQQQGSANGLNPAAIPTLGSIPNLLSSSIPNSLYGAMPSLFGTPQLFAMSPAPASIGSAANLNSNQQNGGSTPNQQNGANKPRIDAASLTSSIPNIQQLNTGGVNPQQAQYLFTAIPNLGSSPITVTSPAQQQAIFNVNMNGTPGSIGNISNDQQATIQQSGWGLANMNQNNAVQGNINVIQTQQATNFVNPNLYPRTQ